MARPWKELKTLIAIGILLLIAAIAAAAMVATGGDTYAQATFGALRIENTTAFFFFGGALTSVVLLIGAWFVVRGYVRWRERGRELRRLREQVVDLPTQPTPESRDRDASTAEVGAGEPAGSGRRGRAGYVPAQASSSERVESRSSPYVTAGRGSDDGPVGGADQAGDESEPRPSRYGRSGRYRSATDGGQDESTADPDSSSVSA